MVPVLKGTTDKENWKQWKRKRKKKKTKENDANKKDEENIKTDQIKQPITLLHTK